MEKLIACLIIILDCIKVHKKMQISSIVRDQKKALFGVLNNGITIVCDEVKKFFKERGFAHKDKEMTKDQKVVKLKRKIH